MSKEELKSIEEEIRNCIKCPLHKYRTNAVPGEGSINPDIMFIGEAPGRQEDIQGRPFVGRAGEYLTYLISTLGLKREDVYITNVVKCRPPNNRDPEEKEIMECLPYLRRQVKILKPKIIVALGRHAAKTLASEAGIKFTGITRERGEGRMVNLHGNKVYLFYTYHPAAALYNPNLKAIIEGDFKKIKEILEKKEEVRKSGTLDDFM